MPRILCVANQKGGVGKTTTATCLARALAMTGRRILVIDVDPQGNATSGMGLTAVPVSPAFSPSALPSGIARTAWPGVSAIPAGSDLERLSIHGLTSTGILRRSLEAIPKRIFEVVLIDCPPSLGPLTQNAFCAAQAVLIPIQCEYYPLEGLVQLLTALAPRANTTQPLPVGGIILTMFDYKVPLSHEVETEIRSKLTHPVFRAVIPRDVAVAEAPSHCLSVIDYAPRSNGTRGYVQLAQEICQSDLLTGLT